MTLEALVLLLATLPWAGLIGLRSRSLLHILQIEEYDTGRFWRWVWDDPQRALPSRPLLAFALGALILAILSGALPSALVLIFAVMLGAAGAVALFRRPRRQQKKPLKLTPRALLILGLTLLGAVIVALAIAAIVGLPTTQLTHLALGLVVGTGFAEVLTPLLVAAANLALVPVQSIARRRVVERARRKLAASNATVVGITGSYGKTSTKEMLATVLETRRRTLKTPESYNTALGVAGVILRQLRPDHELFVVEMGAYIRGEIRRLCKLAPPKIGILTAVNPQHLERFGSIENIAKAKYELVQALPADGTAIFNIDNDWCRKLADQTQHVRVFRFSLEGRAEADLVACDVKLGPRGVDLTMRTRDGQSERAHLAVLGRHNAGNFLAAAAGALACGLTLAEVAAAAPRVQPVPHRLQPIEGAGGVLVIDDAYNSNPDGARAALEVLRSFDGARKVLVTPGMIELGDREDAENEAFGAASAAVASHVILVGPKRTEPIRRGLLAAGFPASEISTVRGLDEVTAMLGTLVGAGDVVLFENDLPDNYTEE